MVDFAGIQAAAAAQGGVEKNAEIEAQLAAIEARKGVTAEGAVEGRSGIPTQEEFNAIEAEQLKNSKNSTSDEPEDPFEKARQDSAAEYDKPGPTEKDVAVDTPAKSGDEKVSATRSVPVYTPRINPLHKYATYTYGITLYILPSEEINALTEDPASWEPNWGSVRTCLISSGGKNTAAYARNDNFKDDFYFENLKMTTVVGMNSRSKSSNAIDISFTILEPYGMSLLDRIIAVADDLKAPNFKSMPYLLEIDFYGQTDTGLQEISSQKKRIPIQIIEFKIKAGAKGSEYAIKAIPWNHQALSQNAATTPINLEVSAETIKDFFSNSPMDELAIIEQSTSKANAKNDSKRVDANSTDKGRTPAQTEQLKSNEKIMEAAYASSSFCGGVNGWYKDLVIKKLRGTQDSISFLIHEDIINSKIVRPQNKDITRSAAVTKKDEQETAQTVKQSAKNGANAFNNKGAFSVSAGTSILHVIDMVMRNSDYVKSQITDPKDTRASDLAERLGKPLNWYKVIPSVKVGKFDYAMGKFSKHTTYSIVPYIVYDSKHPNGPVTAPSGSMKKYSYTYTGKNTDILDFQIDFDTLFYTAVTAGSAKWQANKIQQAEQQIDSANKVAIESMQSASALVNRQLHLVPNQPQQQGMGGQQQDAQTVLAGDMQKNLYSTVRGDMLNLKLKIVGDPELIKQDDIYTNPVQDSYSTEAKSDILASGSIPMDSGEVICQVDFKTIMDMDQKTGLPKASVEPDKSTFTGQYRILTVENTFAGGKFEQVLDMVRLPEIANANTIHKNSPDPANSSFPKKDTGTATNGTRKPDGEEESESDSEFKLLESESDNEPASETTFDEFGNVVDTPQQLGDAQYGETDDAPENYNELNDIANNGETRELSTEQVDVINWDKASTIETKQVDVDF